MGIHVHLSVYLDLDFVMAIQTNIPPDVPDALKAFIFQTLDADLNGTIFDSILQGVSVHLPTYRYLIIFGQAYTLELLL